MTIRVAIDCMGGDHGLAVTVPAALAFLRGEPEAVLLLVGRAEQIEPVLAGADGMRDRVEVVHADEVVAMDDPPALALRGKRNSLKTLDGIDRPAIASVMPNQKGGTTTVLDLGANVDCTAEHLLQFAVLGSSLVAAVEEKERPTVGLLNIGEEAIKGNEVAKQAAELLRASPLNFHGNVEGNDIYKGTTDVIVCDGFVGNVALKASEGLAQMLAGMIREEFTRGPLSRALALLAYPVLARLKRRVDPRRYNGASLLGLRGIVIKSHGSADAYGFEQAIRRACEAARHRLLDRTIAAMQPFVAQLGAAPPPAGGEPPGDDPVGTRAVAARVAAR